MQRMIWYIVILLIQLTPNLLWARGGGGCLVEGTLIASPKGAIAIESLKPNDPIWSILNGNLQLAKVKALRIANPEEYVEISTSEKKLQVTPEHPVMAEYGQYRNAGQLQTGEMVFIVHNGKLEKVTLQSVRRNKLGRKAYNLLVAPGGTFISEGFIVHNKGCFLPDSPILKSDGTESQISRIQPGDKLLAFTQEGHLVRTTVQEILRYQVDEYILLKTDRTTLQVTVEHPFYVGLGTFKTVEILKEGDTIFAWDGQWLAPQRIISIQRVRKQVDVFNLQTDHPNTFFANRIAVHNKGGCFPAGTRIATPNGPVAIESLTSGDEVLAVKNNGVTVRTTVKNIFIEKTQVLRIETGRGVLITTKEHPISLWEGGFRQAGDLKPGDRITRWKDGRLVVKTVRNGSLEGDGELVFNLQVDEPHSFIAEGILVHNKGGGCFPTGTLIQTPKGQIPIERLLPQDSVLSFDPEKRMVETQVEKIFSTFSQILVIETDCGLLRTTVDHPVGLSSGTFIQAGDLQPGDKVLAWKDGRIQTGSVLRTSLEAKEQRVYNLSVGWPHTFLASDFITHNKGGSSSRSSSSSHSSSRGGGSSGGGEMSWILFLIIFSVMFIIPFLPFILAWRAWKGKKNAKSENLDFIYSRNKVAPKTEKTEKLLSFLSQQDPAMSPEELRRLAESTFRKLQQCWQARDYIPMSPFLMPNLFTQHTAQLQGMVQNHEINRIENLKVERLDLVNLRYTNKPDQREFTALITASARDYYVDDRTGKFLRGDMGPARFQEFWTFQLSGGQWFLREIEQTGESDALKDENFVEMLTDETIKGIYGEATKEKGKAGPWLEKETQEKATQIERLLNFLVKTDKLWNRTQMLERARQVFLNVYLARESGDHTRVPVGDVFPELEENLRTQIQHWQKNNLRVEYRNLCVRKVELILVRNFTDQTKDEFTVRISAHAQRITIKKGKITNQQEYVTPFEEYWVFGRLNNQWKLKEVLPPVRGKEKLADKNVDEDSSPDQLQWYYRQTRSL